MPLHDWTRVNAGTFHAFHHDWITDLGRALNRGLLPKRYYAFPEQRVGRPIPDVLTLERQDAGGRRAPSSNGRDDGGGTAVAVAPPRLRLSAETSEAEWIAAKQKRLTVRTAADDRAVAVIEIVSPGNKNHAKVVGEFVEKSVELIQAGIHLMVIDLLPPVADKPLGLGNAVWRELSGRGFDVPDGRPMTICSFESGETVRAYAESVSVGSPLPDGPLFYEFGHYVNVPLEATYNANFAEYPERWREVLDTP